VDDANAEAVEKQHAADGAERAEQNREFVRRRKRAERTEHRLAADDDPVIHGVPRPMITMPPALVMHLRNAVDYRIVVGGKPMFSPFGAFPPSYELTILLGAFGAIGGMLFLNRLPRLHHPLLKNKRFGAVTHDKFFIVIETTDPKYSEAETRKLLEAAGSQHIEMVEE